MVSYNPWAIDWSHNHFPSKTWDYPQLLPTNWSICYVLIGPLNGGLPLEFFPRMIMGLFPLFALWLLWQKALNAQSDELAMGLVLFALLLYDMLSTYIGHGYADIPVQVMGLAAILVLLESKVFSLKTLLMGSALAAASSLTKQAGLWLVFVYPILSYLLLIKSQKFSRIKVYGLLGLQIIIMLSISLTWYAHAWFITGHQALEWGFLTHGVYQSASQVSRLDFAYEITNAWYWLMVIVAIWAVRQKSEWRTSFVLISIPIMVIWLAGYDYDNRNLALGMPYIAMMAGLSITKWANTELIQRFMRSVAADLNYIISHENWLLRI
jgi:hypothetical protein